MTCQILWFPEFKLFVPSSEPLGESFITLILVFIDPILMSSLLNCAVLLTPCHRCQDAFIQCKWVLRVQYSNLLWSPQVLCHWWGHVDMDTSCHLECSVYGVQLLLRVIYSEGCGETVFSLLLRCESLKCSQEQTIGH